MFEIKMLDTIKNPNSLDCDFYNAVNEFLFFKEKYEYKFVKEVLSLDYVIARFKKLYMTLAEINKVKKLDRVFACYCKTVLQILDGQFVFYRVDSVNLEQETIECRPMFGREEKVSLAFDSVYPADSVRFTDTHYNNLFYIVSPGKIYIGKDDSISEKCVIYIDEFHCALDGVVFHICEFAERVHNKNMKRKELGKPDIELYSFI